MKDPIKPVARANRTKASVHDPEITYNEAGISYNETGYAYGGLYGYDIQPMFAQARAIAPRIRFGQDFASVATQSRTLGRGMLIGMLGMTYKEDITVSG